MDARRLPFFVAYYALAIVIGISDGNVHCIAEEFHYPAYTYTYPF
jgi:hypothetical protein